MIDLTDLTSDKFFEFVLENEDRDTERLVLSPPKGTSIDIKAAAEQILCRRRAKEKIPEWYGKPKVLFPSRLSLEQCSSEATAKLKSSWYNGDLFLDLTAGAGVDTFYFSKNFEKVLATEQNPYLASLTSYNLSILGAPNVEVINSDGVEFLRNTKEDFDLIYLDPSRRAAGDSRVFRLEDCTPDVLHLKDLLVKKGKKVLIKTSPFLDITDSIRKLEFVVSVRIVSVKNEVKEVLYELNAEIEEGVKISTYDIRPEGTTEFAFEFQEDIEIDLASPDEYLFEPNAAILKGGGMNVLAKEYELRKLAVNTHLYTSSSDSPGFPGRRFKVKKIYKDLKSAKKEIKNSRFNVISRNYPIDAQSLMSRYQIVPGKQSDFLIFARDLKSKLIIQAERLGKD